MPCCSLSEGFSHHACQCRHVNNIGLQPYNKGLNKQGVLTPEPSDIPVISVKKGWLIVVSIPLRGGGGTQVLNGYPLPNSCVEKQSRGEKMGDGHFLTNKCLRHLNSIGLTMTRLYKLIYS